MIAVYLLNDVARGTVEFNSIFTPKFVHGEIRDAAIKRYPSYVENDAIQAYMAAKLFHAGRYIKIAELATQTLDDAFFMMSSNCQQQLKKITNVCKKYPSLCIRAAQAGDIFVNRNQKYLRGMFGWIAI